MSPRTADSPYGGAGMPAVDQPKILLMGPRRYAHCGLTCTRSRLLFDSWCVCACARTRATRRAGKSSIQRVVFQKMSPHETLFLEATNNLDIKFIANNSFVQFQIWDLPGDYDFRGGWERPCLLCAVRSPSTHHCPTTDIITYDGQTFSAEAILNNCGAIIYVVDAQDDPYTEALENLLETIMRAHEVNPEISVDVFIHKVDGDLFLGDEAKLGASRPRTYCTRTISYSRWGLFWFGLWRRVPKCHRVTGDEGPRGGRNFRHASVFLPHQHL